MIIPNGTISFITKVGGGVDDNGYPVAACKSYGDCIPCQYSATSHTYLGRTEGEPYIRASYEILVEHLIPFTKTEYLVLRDRLGRVVKETSVIQFEPLDAVRQMRIII